MKTPTLLASLLLVPLVALHAVELKLPALFTNHMVLQRDAAVPVWCQRSVKVYHLRSN
jgi:hypothetical protein